MTQTKLTAAQKDRAAGVLLGMASGDALGAGYEFGPPLSSSTPVVMNGGGGFNWAPGEWTDDTSMAVLIARAAADGLDLRDDKVLDGIVAQWVQWAKTAPDVGIQLRAVLSKTEPTASAVRAVAKAHHERHGRSGGNGSLMRTAPVALAYLDDPVALAEAARAISSLTHYEADAGDACVLWCLAIRHAVLEGELDVRVGLSALPADRRELWAERIAVAETSEPKDFAHNGWVVEALQGAWSAISTINQADATHLRLALEAAVRGGRDTDTVAAIAGGLLGARWGASAVPAEWRRIVHGWPGLTGADLVRLGGRICGDAHKERFDYAYLGDVSTLVQHPHDEGVWIGAAGALDALPREVDAVVSLCRVGTKQVPPDIQHHVEVRLIDKDDPAENPNLDFVLLDTVNAIAALRAEGHTVLVHCAQAQSRTPSVGALYAALHRGVAIDWALRQVLEVLPPTTPKRFLQAAITRLAADTPETSK
ncbi:ADP-ribosylglycohydrolase family protein [Cryobacterium sp. TMT1-66-1]|uniref:ADP-ribosylglycohydrolase family protein n=1 Tax=Cryobacterium sp. TMT1-66-1 TaxID=1259242 RepID=UPI00106CB69D|nr:ADP-ribosylglycohydrolase family protein [Cryobacterium sp. TMT1-66-1]TFD05527.1 ADP-ribosylglycohydrolase family protein [Cryobacterium sp. TMT1-66-1]